MPNIDLSYFKGVLAVGIVIFLLSQFPEFLDPPQEWVIAWTDWLMIYVGIGVSARGLWIISEAIAKRIEKS